MPDRHAAAREYVERYAADLAEYRKRQPNPPASISSRSIDLGLLAVLAALLADADELGRLRREVAELREALEHIAELASESRQGRYVDARQYQDIARDALIRVPAGGGD